MDCRGRLHQDDRFRIFYLLLDMLSFEEFFAKKKIDLTALKADRPELYEEFSAHYGQMGEKSFDHTKKYWFNKLRMDYKLSTPLAVTPPKKEPEPVATDAKTVDTATAVKPSGFKPRFKTGIAQAKKQEEEEVVETKPVVQPVAKPAGFKPRFKANVTKKTAVEVDKEPKDKTEGQETKEGKVGKTEGAPVNKPAGFKPRFKAGLTKNKPKDED